MNPCFSVIPLYGSFRLSAPVVIWNHIIIFRCCMIDFRLIFLSDSFAITNTNKSESMKTNFHSLLRVLSFFFLCTMCSVTSHSQTTYSYNYTGSVQTINLPAGTYSIEVWGADGGNATNGTNSTFGGKGGYSRGIYTNPTTSTFSIYVGGRGGNASGSSVGAGGGGMSDIETSASSLIIVAGGGGGGTASGTTSENSDGGHGGGLTGGTAQDNTGVSGGTPATGGSQTAGGSATAGSYGAGNPGGYGHGGGAANGGSDGARHGAGGAGGNGGTGGWNGGGGGSTVTGINDQSGGGGAGYFGGGGGRGDGGAGGGGSSYIGGVSSATTIMFGQSGFPSNPDVAGNGFVIIKELCDVIVQASSNPICEGASITLSTNAGSNIQWSSGPTSASISVSPNTTTSYTVSGVSSSSSACSATVAITVTVNPNPQINTTIIPAVLCPGNAATVIATGANNYSWTSVNQQSSTVALSPMSTTVYTVTGNNEFGCATSKVFTVPVSANILSISGNSTICQGQAATLTASGLSSYQWSNASVFPSIIVSPAITTSYAVTGVDADNCAESGTATVTVLNLPSVSVTATRSLVCRGEIIELTGSGADSYSWGPGGSGSTYTQVASVDVPQKFTVTGTGNNGCKNSATVTVVVEACVGIAEQKNLQFSIAPNPAHDRVTITSAAELEEVIITDLSGRVVHKAINAGKNHQVSLSELAAGVYQVQIRMNNSTNTTKLIRN